MLNYTRSGGASVVAMDEAHLPFSEIEFLNRVTNQNGEAIVGRYSASQVADTCNFGEFSEKLQIVNGHITHMQQNEDPEMIRKIRFLIDSIKMSDAWFACLQLLEGLITSSTTTTTTISTTCTTSIYDVDSYNNDTCCWELPAWHGVCRPRPINSTLNIVNTNVDAVEQQ